MSILTDEELRSTARWIAHFASDWRGDIPTKIHEHPHGAHYGLGSSPPFSGEFIGYIGYLYCNQPHCQSCKEKRTSTRRVVKGENYRHKESKTRTRRAFRKLRAIAPLEYDVLWLAVMHGLTIQEITVRLNQRQTEWGKNPEFSPSTVAVLAASGIDKVRTLW